jgi:ABC-type multidrug transport system fused ATPase/permease subunit
MSLFKAYTELAGWVKVKAVFAVLLIAIAGLLEGSALLALLPVLSKGETSDENQQIFLQRLLDYLQWPESYLVPTALALFVILGISASVARFAAEKTNLRVRTRIEELARIKMGEALLNMEWSRFIQMRTGDISKAMIMEGFQMGIGIQIFLQALGALLASFVYLGTAFLVSAKLTLLTVLFGAVGGVGYLLIARRNRVHAEQLSGMVSDISDRINDIFGNLKFFRATGNARRAEQRAKSIYKEYANTYYWSQIHAVIMRLFFEGGGILFIGGFMLFTIVLEQQDVAEIIVFLAIFYRLVPRIFTVQDGLLQSRTYLSWYVSWKERLENAQQNVVQSSGREQPSFNAELKFNDVSYRYPGTAHDVLKKVSFCINPGECVAVVGASGSGKSTMVDLLTGLFHPRTGQVVLDGKSLLEIDLEQWQKHIGIVMQDTPIFHDTLKNNITWESGREDKAKLDKVLRMAHVDEFVSDLPEGLETQVGERGAKFSGGQRQRIAIARALYQEPWLLILDEATSALDGASEAKVQAALEGIKGECAIFMVAHRLGTVRMADKILVLDQGGIIEQGSWDELISNRNNVFFQMAKLQGLIE